MMQAAFKRSPANSLGAGAGEEGPALDWEKVKPEDKTLAHQVYMPYLFYTVRNETVLHGDVVCASVHLCMTESDGTASTPLLSYNDVVTSHPSLEVCACQPDVCA